MRLLLMCVRLMKKNNGNCGVKVVERSQSKLVKTLAQYALGILSLIVVCVLVYGAIRIIESLI